MAELWTGEIAGQSYRVDRLPAMKQLHVARRIAPVLSAFVEAFRQVVPTDLQGVDVGTLLKEQKVDPLAAIEPLAKALAKMTDDDAEFVVGACMSVVTRQQPNGTGWAKVTASNGRMMFADMDDPSVFLPLVWKVIEAHILPFSSALPQVPAGQAQGRSAS